MAKIPRTESLVAEHLLNEAGSGQTPLVAADKVGPGDNELGINWGRGNGGWTSIPTGFGLNFADSVNTANTNIATMSDNVADSGTIGAKFGSSVTRACMHMVVDPRVGHNFAMRLMALGSSGGNTVFSVLLNVNNLHIRWNQEGPNSGDYYAQMNQSHEGDRYIISVYVDTTEEVAADRIRVYFNGARRQLDGTSKYPPQNNAADFNRPEYFYTLGNRPARDRNPEASIYYISLRNDIDDEGEVAKIYASLLANNNESPFGPGEPPTGEDGNATGNLADVSITAIRGFATIVGQGHGEGSIADINIAPIEGFAKHFGDGVALGKIADIDITPVDGSAISIKIGNAAGTLADLSIIPIAGSADVSDRGLALGSIADIKVTPVDGSAHVVMHGDGTATLSDILITPIDGYATIDGSSFASGGLANILITPIDGRASVPSDDGSASGLLANITITPVDGSAISIKDGVAAGSIVDIAITPILGFADIGQRGQASGSLADVFIPPIDGIATATVEANAIGLLANVQVDPIIGFAIGEGYGSAFGSLADVLVTPVKGFATFGAQIVPTITFTVELTEAIELTTTLNTTIQSRVTP